MNNGRDWRAIRRSCLSVIVMFAVCIVVGLTLMWFLLWLLEMALPEGTH